MFCLGQQQERVVEEVHSTINKVCHNLSFCSDRGGALCRRSEKRDGKRLRFRRERRESSFSDFNEEEGSLSY